MLDIYKAVEEGNTMTFSIVVTILFSFLYRRIEKPVNRKWFGTVIGLPYSLMVLGFHAWHTILYALLCTFIIKKKYKGFHLTVTVVSIFYISMFRFFYYEETKGSLLAATMISMSFVSKFSGLSFEISSSKNKKNEEDYITDPSTMDMFHFIFCYILAWPAMFCKYKTYDDFINRPFYKFIETKWFVLSRITKMIIIHYLYLYVQGKLWPMQYIMTEEFLNRSIWYKMIYSTIHLELYLWLGINIFILIELKIAIAGFGAYPIQGNNKPGKGPTKEHKNISNMTMEQASKQSYDFNTIKNYDHFKVLFSPWMVNTISSWNTTGQYWLKSIVYKRLNTKPENKLFAMYSTMIFSALWHGINPGIIITYILLGFLAEISKIYWRINQHINDWKSIPYHILMWVLKKFFMGIVTMPFFLFNWYYIHQYFSAVYYIPFALLSVYYIIGKMIFSYLKNRKINKNY